MSKISAFIDRYIKGKYHCDTCPYCWGGGYNAGCDDYDDCGCYIKGEIADNACRLLPPFRFFLGYFSKKKGEYHFNHKYDDYAEFAERQDNEQDEFNRLMNEFLSGYELCWKGENGVYNPINTEMHIRQEAWRVRFGYDDFAHPTKYIPLNKQWSGAIKNTFGIIVGAIKPYFCK